MKIEKNNNILTLFIEGRFDSSNSERVESEITELLEAHKPASVIIDASELEYISSSGLRVILKIKKSHPALRVINVNSSVYEIFDITGFTEIVDIEKAYREFDISGCELIGEGANGKVYRFNRDTIVKVYKNADTLEDIKRERELSRKAFVLGIPTAIPYDVVKVGDTYGSVFELLDAKSFDELLIEDESNLEFAASESVKIARAMHSTDAPDGLPCQSDEARIWLNSVRSYFSGERASQLEYLIKTIPERGTLIHGDFHIKNIMRQKDETLLIDMDTLCSGHPIYELAFMFNAYKGFGVVDKKTVADFLGVSADTAYRLWRRSLELYFDTIDAVYLDEIEQKASVIGYLRLMRRPIDKGLADTPAGSAMVEACRNKLNVLIDTVDTLAF